MQSSHPRRLGAVVVPVIVGAFLLASCGAADNAATQSTIDLSAASTAFVVRPPATTVPVADTVAPAAGDVVATEQEYVVQASDTPIGVANMFNVPVADLIAYNEWGPNEFAYPGDTIKIPPGGTAPGATVTEDAAATADDRIDRPGRNDSRCRRQLRPGRLHHRRRRLRRQGGDEVRCHRRGIASGQRQHAELLVVLPRPRDRHSRQSRLLTQPTAGSLEDEVRLLDDVHGGAARDRVAVAGEQDRGVGDLGQSSQTLGHLRRV